MALSNQILNFILNSCNKHPMQISYMYLKINETTLAYTYTEKQTKKCCIDTKFL